MVSIQVTILVTLIVMLIFSVCGTFYRDLSTERSMVEQGQSPLKGTHYLNILMLGLTTVIGYVVGYLITQPLFDHQPQFWTMVLVLAIYVLCGAIVKYLYIFILAIYKFIKQANGKD